MKNFLFDTFIEVVSHRTDKYSLHQIGNIRRWYQAIHLGIYGSGFVVVVNGHRLVFLQHLTEAVA